MTTATVAAPTGNEFSILLAIFLLITFTTCVVLWVHEHRWDRHDAELADHIEQLAGIWHHLRSLEDFLDVDVQAPVADDSPQAMAGDDTDEFPAVPDTQPDGIAVQVQGALLEAQTHKGDGEMVERSVNIGGTVQTFRIRANKGN